MRSHRGVLCFRSVRGPKVPLRRAPRFADSSASGKRVNFCRTMRACPEKGKRLFRAGKNHVFCLRTPICRKPAAFGKRVNAAILIIREPFIIAAERKTPQSRPQRRRTAVVFGHQANRSNSFARFARRQYMRKQSHAFAPRTPICRFFGFREEGKFLPHDACVPRKRQKAFSRGQKPRFLPAHPNLPQTCGFRKKSECGDFDNKRAFHHRRREKNAAKPTAASAHGGCL